MFVCFLTRGIFLFQRSSSDGVTIPEDKSAFQVATWLVISKFSISGSV